MGCKGTKFFSHSGIQPPKSFVVVCNIQYTKKLNVERKCGKSCTFAGDEDGIKNMAFRETLFPHQQQICRQCRLSRHFLEPNPIPHILHS